MQVKKLVIFDLIILIAHYILFKNFKVFTDSEFISLLVMINTLCWSYMLQCKRNDEEHKKDIIKLMPFLNYKYGEVKNGYEKLDNNGETIFVFSTITFEIINVGVGICKNIELAYIDYRKNCQSSINDAEILNKHSRLYPITKRVLTHNETFKLKIDIKELFEKNENKYFKLTFKFEDIYDNQYLQSILICFDDACKYSNSNLPSRNKNGYNFSINSIEDMLVNEFFELPCFDE